MEEAHKSHRDEFLDDYPRPLIQIECIHCTHDAIVVVSCVNVPISKYAARANWLTDFFFYIFFFLFAICSLAEKTTHSSSIENALVSLRPRYIGVDTLSYSGHDRAIEHVHGGGEPKKNATNFHNIGTTDGGACSNAAWAKSRGGERAWKSNATEH